MTDFPRKPAFGLLLALGLTACGGGDGGAADTPVPEEPFSIDYSSLQLAQSRELPLQYARNPEQILRPLRNGVRMMTSSGALAAAGNATFTSDASAAHSNTTVQVSGVDEADSVKYDGRHIFATRRQVDPPSSSSSQFVSRNVLNIARTNTTTSTVQPVSTYVIEGEQSSTPLIYQLTTSDGTAETLVAVSQDYRGWFMPILPIASLALYPDRTTIQLLDVRDPQNVSQSWKLELDGWLSASRLIGDTLYLVSSYRPRVADLILPADTTEKREENERRIRSASLQELLPAYSENGGPKQALASPSECLVSQQISTNDSYTDILVISAINVRTRRVVDVDCLSTNVNGVYMSTSSLYIAGTGFQPDGATPVTVLHKFAIDASQVTYRATGAVVGTVSWNNPSYFMDEHEGDLRILTSVNNVHRLNVLRESAGQTLSIVATLPNPSRPAAIGKPGESVQGVRFVGERAYVVTFRLLDPLYVIDLRNPLDPAIAGELEIPGFSTYLRPVGNTDSDFLLAVGQQADPTAGLRQGVKIELFDVRDITNPRSIGAHVFGGAGTSSDGLFDPHALTFLATPAPNPSLRLALPIDVYETPTGPGSLSWTYSGVHLLEVTDTDTATPQLRFQGVVVTDEPDPAKTFPAYSRPVRGVLHGDSVFTVAGPHFLGNRWQDVSPR